MTMSTALSKTTYYSGQDNSEINVISNFVAVSPEVSTNRFAKDTKFKIKYT